MHAPDGDEAGARLARVHVVLVRPRDAANVGAAARAMKNMGLDRLVLVAPARFDAARAARLAVHAHDVLDARRTAPTLADAVAGCGLVVGTCGRPAAVGAGAQPPRALAPVIAAAAARNDVALVFGTEDRGLSNTELALCHRLLSIPAHARYPSLNLAQAVLVCAYELHLALGATGSPPARALAPSARWELMYARLEEALLAIGFLHPDTRGPMMRKLRRTLGRAALDDDEVRVVLGMARQMLWAAGRRRGGTPRN